MAVSGPSRWPLSKDVARSVSVVLALASLCVTIAARAIDNDVTFPFPTPADLRWAQFGFWAGAVTLLAMCASLLAFWGAIWARKPAVLLTGGGLLASVFFEVAGLGQFAEAMGHGNDWGHLNAIDSFFSGIVVPLILVTGSFAVLVALRAGRS